MDVFPVCLIPPIPFFLALGFDIEAIWGKEVSVSLISQSVIWLLSQKTQKCWLEMKLFINIYGIAAKIGVRTPSRLDTPELQTMPIVLWFSFVDVGYKRNERHRYDSSV